MAVFLVALHGFERAEHTQFAFDRNADAVRQFGDLASDVDVVLVAGDGLAVGFQRAVHHHRGEAGLDRGHAHRRALAVILVHDHRNVRVSFEGGQDLVAQEGFASVFAGAGRSLHDHRGVELAGRFHNRPDLFHVVDVEGGQAVIIFGSMIEQLAQGNERHGNSCEI